MSFYYCKDLIINKEGEIIAGSFAANNVTPITYYRSDYGDMSKESFEEKVAKFLKSCLDGNIHLLSSCGKYYTTVKQMRKYMSSCTNFDNDVDWHYKCGTRESIMNLIIKEYGIPKYLGFKVKPGIQDKLDALNVTLPKIYQDAKDEYAQKGYVQDRSCCRIDFLLFNDETADLFLVVEGSDNPISNSFIIAEKKCYTSVPLGFCNIKAGTYIEFMGNINIFQFFNNSVLQTAEFDKVAESVWKEIAEAGFELAYLPYPEFPYEEYGFKKPIKEER